MSIRTNITHMTWQATHDGDANFFVINQPTNWVARIQFNGEFHSVHQEAFAQAMAAAPDLILSLRAAVERVKLANAHGNPILSAWLPDAVAALAKAGVA